MSLLCIPPGGRHKPKKGLAGDSGATPKQGILVLWVAGLIKERVTLDPASTFLGSGKVVSKRDYGTDLEDGPNPETLFGLVEG